MATLELQKLMPHPHHARQIWKECSSLWKHIKSFLSTLRQRNLKTQQSLVILDLCLRKLWHHCFGKAPFWKCSLFALKQKAAVLKFLRLKQCFHLKSAHFRGKLWTEDLTAEIKLHFQISLGQCGRGLSVVVYRVLQIQPEGQNC